LGQNNANLEKIDGKPKFEAAILIFSFLPGKYGSRHGIH